MKNKQLSLIEFETKLWNQNYNLICGLDEVGRGCIAGPLVAAAVILPKNYFNPQIKDSKLLSNNQRQKLYNEIKLVAIDIATYFVPVEKVDELNPKQASIYAMQECIKQLKTKPDYILIDFERLDSNINQLSIVKGDQRSQSIAAASIIAKVTRDNYMLEIAHKYDLSYDLEHNKGYLTKKHLWAIETLGPIKGLHRFSYKPIKQIKK